MKKKLPTKRTNNPNDKQANELSRCFSEKYNVQSIHERFSTILSYWELQIECIASITSPQSEELWSGKQKTTNTDESAEKRRPLHTAGGCVSWDGDWEPVWRFLQPTKTKLPYYPSILLLGMFPKQPKSVHHGDPCAWFRTAFSQWPSWKQPRWASTDGWIKKTCGVETMKIVWL